MHLVRFEVFHLICAEGYPSMQMSPEARIAYKELPRELNG